ncbi:MAG TPA: hypothetical protein VJW20_20620 [Candidatus Angelobacter sp.]|nr:hypothetical protein [Candidatus Angelobacter sp.]
MGIYTFIDLSEKMNHSFEEIRSVALDLLAGRESASHPLDQYERLLLAVSDVFQRREGRPARFQHFSTAQAALSNQDREIFLEVFWTLFREGIITLGLDDANRAFPWFRITTFGQRLIAHQQAYFFHDVSSYESLIKSEVPQIDSVTLLYLKEAMQSFRTGCVLASTVMLGVATEHTFLLLVDKIEQNATHAPIFASVGQQRTILQKVNKFRNILDQQTKSLPSEINEDIDTHFTGILSIIRTFRNQSGHPTGKIIDREQAYVLLQLFIPYCKKMYQLMAHYA